MYVYLNIKKGLCEEEQKDHYTRAYPLTGCFVANKEVGSKRDRGPWNITHVPTGLKVCTVRLLKDCYPIAHKLERMWPGWASNDRVYIRGNVPGEVLKFLKEVTL